jgi:hypothetical protein
MALYTFFPCQSDGPALCFETLELDSDAAALAPAAELLGKHATASFVTVWCAERMVCSVPRIVAPREGQMASRPSASPDAEGCPGDLPED